MTVLVTGFGPFLDIAINPSGLIATGLSGRAIAGPGSPLITSAVLPVAFDAAAGEVAALIDSFRPVATVLIGVARGPDYRLERRAIPSVTSAHPDATGLCHAGRRLGETPRQTTRDVATLAAALKGLSLDAVASDDCGGYVCNSTYYAALATAPDALFLHIPPATDDAALAHGSALVVRLLQLMVGLNTRFEFQ